MSKSSAAALALASLCACAGAYTNGSTPINPIDGGGSGGSSDGGSDAGADGGADGGVDAGPDAGCAPLTLNGLAVRDACAGSAQLPQSGFANISVSDAGTCQADITLDTSSTPCTGTASGGSVDMFSGTCAAMQCGATSLPGSIFCSRTSGLCQILICDAGTCPP
jgi:hypothetical protein